MLKVRNSCGTDERLLTDAGLDLHCSVLEYDIGILLADEVVVLQELTRDPADGVCLAVGCHDDLVCAISEVSEI